MDNVWEGFSHSQTPPAKGKSSYLAMRGGGGGGELGKGDKKGEMRPIP